MVLSKQKSNIFKVCYRGETWDMSIVSPKAWNQLSKQIDFAQFLQLQQLFQEWETASILHIRPLQGSVDEMYPPSS